MITIAIIIPITIPLPLATTPRTPIHTHTFMSRKARAGALRLEALPVGPPDHVRNPIGSSATFDFRCGR
eukprot:9477026-Pyramimonas_sp.AAC.1